MGTIAIIILLHGCSICIYYFDKGYSRHTPILYFLHGSHTVLKSKEYNIHACTYLYLSNEERKDIVIQTALPSGQEWDRCSRTDHSRNKLTLALYTTE